MTTGYSLAHGPSIRDHAETFFCGYCLCGHDWTDHHDDKGACEFWGSNETAGLDETETKPHCFRYVDREDPNSGIEAGPIQG